MSAGIVTDTVTRIFSDLADPQTLNGAADRAWFGPFWRAAEDNGLTRAWIAESLGGAGLSLSEGFEIVGAAGRFALPVPLVETMMAGWLLAQAGLEAPPLVMTAAPVRPQDHVLLKADGALHGTVRNIPFVEDADFVAVLVSEPQTGVALVRTADCRTRMRQSLSDDQRSDIILDDVTPVAFGPADLDPSAWMQMGSVIRSVQIAGALQGALSLSVDYANERVAFGKPIGRFQAVQNNLARLAGEAAAAAAAATSAADAVALDPSQWDEGVFLETSAAKIRCAEAVETGMAIAHQVHGAIGLTVEHVLHRFSLRAQGWCGDFGTSEYWSVSLGERIAAGGGDKVWALVAAR